MLKFAMSFILRCKNVLVHIYTDLRKAKALLSVIRKSRKMHK